jgi:hypothetical protein
MIHIHYHEFKELNTIAMILNKGTQHNKYAFNFKETYHDKYALILTYKPLTKIIQVLINDYLYRDMLTKYLTHNFA